MGHSCHPLTVVHFNVWSNLSFTYLYSYNPNVLMLHIQEKIRLTFERLCHFFCHSTA